MKHARTGQPSGEPSFMFKFGIKIMLWGSDEVVKEYSSFRREIGRVAAKVLPSTEKPAPKLPNSISGLDFVSSMESLILKIRADIGHKNKGIKRGDLLSAIMDVKEIDSLVSGEKG